MLMKPVLLLAVVLIVGACGDATQLAGPGPDAGGPSAGGSSGGNPSAGPLTQDGACPAVYPAVDGPWVPELPGAETDDWLVPDADPVLAHICRYTGRQNSGEPVELELAGEADVRAGLGVVRRDLHLPALLEGAGRSCTQVGGELVPHLVRFDYADGSVWVSAAQEPNSCTDSGNGAFVTGVHLGDRLATAFDTGRWSPAPVPERCWPGAGGRAGQEVQLVPDDWTTVTVCQSGMTTPARRRDCWTRRPPPGWWR